MTLRSTALAVVAALLAGTASAGQPGVVLYLHGRIVQEQQSARPRHPQYGYYEVQKIVDAFRERDFVVNWEMRPRTATVAESAEPVVDRVRKLLTNGVSAERITVVGASMGASIALLASTRLQNPKLRFVFLGACFSASDRALLAENGKGPSGHLLAIRETSDDLTADCAAWTNDRPASVPAFREVVLRTGLNHGFIYRPLPEWVVPVAEWAGGDAH